MNLVWKCLTCGLLHQGKDPPEKCPNFQAPKEEFELVEALLHELVRARLGPSAA